MPFYTFIESLYPGIYCEEALVLYLMKLENAVDGSPPDVGIFENLIDAMLEMEENFGGEYYWMCTGDRPYRIPSNYREEYIDIFYGD